MICRLARLAWLILLFPATPHAAEPVRVFAAITLKPVLDMIAEEYRRTSGGDVPLVYGPSPALAKQIENGATADLFFSADKEWMDELAQHRLIRPETVIELVTNHLVMIARAGGEHRLTIAQGFPLAQLIGAGPMAMCDPDSHPAGRYGKASLINLGVWQDVETKIARTENPLLAVKMVARGDAPFAIVFATDAATDLGVEIVGTFPDDTHPPILYPVAMTAESRNPDVGAFLAYLRSPQALALFKEHGYPVLGQSE
jgi:molybdate transport system substrate-binding protein